MWYMQKLFASISAIFIPAELFSQSFVKMFSETNSRIKA